MSSFSQIQINNRRLHQSCLQRNFYKVITTPPLTLAKYAIATVILAKLAYDLIKTFQLDQMTAVDCSSFSGVTFSDDPLQNYCMGIHSKNEGSFLIAAKYFSRAGEGGLYLGKEELCRPSLYQKTRVEDLSQNLKSTIESFCCPKGSTALCPWHPLELRRFEKGDDTTNAHHIFW